jgi:hypothetical protein
MRAVLGEIQFKTLLARRPILVQAYPNGPQIELVLADISPERLLELHL